MRKILYFIHLCAILVVLGCTPNEETDLAENAEALMSTIDPTAVKAAIDDGATYDDATEGVNYNGVKFLVVVGGSWALESNGLLMHKSSFQRMAAGDVVTNPETGDKLVSWNGMVFQLAPNGDYAQLIDPP